MDLNVVVERVYKEAVITTWLSDIDLGDVAVVRCGETEFILVSKRALGYGPEVFRDLGVEPDNKQYLLLKHFRGDNHINVGDISTNVKKQPTTAINRPKWPWDENPFDYM